MKIVLIGLPGAGKTTLAVRLAEKLGAVHLNADDIRTNINKDLTFSMEDRIEQSRRIGHLANLISRSGNRVVVDLICPTEETRAFFDDAFIIFVDRIDSSVYEDTNKIFTPPTNADITVTSEGTPQYWTDHIYNMIH